MNRLPWFPMWTVEHKSETARWSLADEGAYIRLMCEMWQVADDSTPPGIVDDSDTIADVLGVTSKEWDRTRRKLLKMAQSPFRIEDGMIRHERLDSAYHAAIAKSEQAKRAIQKRWDSERKTDTDVLRTYYGRNTARNTRNDTGAIPSQNLEHRTQKVVGTPTSQVSMLDSSYTHMSENARENENDTTEPEPETALSVSSSLPARTNGNGAADFERFLEAYPKHRARGAAYEAWALLRRKGTLPSIEVILADIERHKEYDPNWRTERFTPNPARYLTDEGWHDKFQTPSDNALVQALAEGR